MRIEKERDKPEEAVHSVLISSSPVMLTAWTLGSCARTFGAKARSRATVSSLLSRTCWLHGQLPPALSAN